MIQENGSEGVIDGKGILVAIKKCACTDHQPRRVTLTGRADNLYTIPGFVQVSRAGKLFTVIGKAYFSETGFCGAGYYFRADETGKNYAALPA